MKCEICKKETEAQWWKYTRITLVVIIEIVFILAIISAITQPKAIIDCTHGATATNMFGDRFELNINGTDLLLNLTKNENMSTKERVITGLTHTFT